MGSRKLLPPVRFRTGVFFYLQMAEPLNTG